MTKKLCPSCDHYRHITPGKLCGDCATLARFAELPPVDYQGNGALGYSSNTRAYDEPERPHRERFFCLRDQVVISIGEVDAAGRDLVGEDRHGIWFGTDEAPCIVQGDAEGADVVFTLMGRRWDGKSWQGHYMGSRRGALLEVPEQIRVDFIETRALDLRRP